MNETKPFNSCQACGERIDLIECPTGDWWAHENHPTDNHDAVPMPDLSRYDATELNQVTEMVMSELGWQPLSKRYRMATALLDARGRRRA